MPRPKKKGTGPPKTRSRFGCWQCKKRKVKCGEEKPTCKNCQKTREKCDYSIQLKWTTDSTSRPDDGLSQAAKSMPNTPSTIKFPPAEIFSGPTTPNAAQQSFAKSGSPARHGRSRSNNDAAIITQSETGRRNSTMASGIINFQGENSQLTVPKLTAPPTRPQYLNTTWANSGSVLSLATDVVDSKPKLSSYSQGQTVPPAGPVSEVHDGYVTSPDRSKRMKISRSMADSGDLKLPVYDLPNAGTGKRSQSPSQQLYESKPLSMVSPSTASDEFGYSGSGGRFIRPQPNNTLRGSVPVSSLLDEDHDRPGMKFKSETSNFYGFDTGKPDLDIPLNDDQHAIVGSPKLPNATYGENRRMLTINFDNYYSEPIPINIPNRLYSLPPKLTNNHMNLLYFHHFLNHTARILIPYDCPINPYRTVLPQSKPF
jgi:hypothetical protein